MMGFMKSMVQRTMIWNNHKDLQIHLERLLHIIENHLGLEKLFKMQRSMVHQIDLVEKVIYLDHIQVM